ncbi:MAG TPA: FUSC family membrane protein, partial [Flavobacterium sp.]|nr:FUSC family membrane protein [Flavobacterium sp.]
MNKLTNTTFANIRFFMVNKIRRFIDSTNFANALKVTVASAIPVLLFSSLHLFQIGFTIALGALLTFPSDISSNLRHKINGILAAAVIVSGSAFIISLAYPYPWLLYPVLTAMTFLLAMISVYGQRATSISFSGLLSISLVFSQIYEGGELFQHCLLLLLGGLFYLLVSLIFYYIRPYHYLEVQIAQCIFLTSKYLKLRGDLWSIDADRAAILEKQLHLQVELNDIHENLRAVLIGNR